MIFLMMPDVKRYMNLWYINFPSQVLSN